MLERPALLSSAVSIVHNPTRPTLSVQSEPECVHLSKLPAELRLLVYKLTLVSDSVIRPGSSREPTCHSSNYTGTQGGNGVPLPLLPYRRNLFAVPEADCFLDFDRPSQAEATIKSSNCIYLLARPDINPKRIFIFIKSNVSPMFFNHAIMGAGHPALRALDHLIHCGNAEHLKIRLKSTCYGCG
ncbi:hypothetical protein K432DRAFT_412150 [Lepidopterella palustris CBS 459.81]|uniref:Uncharacterized protein n=1 Tax=Lepidopterella palustris CBS 459.81 TaxID=1314670 RepID=A0A8E2J7Q8_9PEZI|nr:hypothetical protein K432DRAFT_412150 [Lepidopterella palustris CBS 459.81]